MLVQDFLHRTAEQRPTKQALICDGRRLTYLELEEMANRFANALIEHGVCRGDRVVICLNNSVELVVSMFGALKAGAVFVNLNPATQEDTLAYIINDCSPAAIIAAGRQATLLDGMVEPSLRLRIFCGRNAKQAAIERERCLSFSAVQSSFPATRPARVNIDRDLAYLIYTSGSTGVPKGVMGDHSNADFASDSIIKLLENQPDDVVLSALPLSFNYGLYQVLMTFKFGGTLVLENGFTYPATVLQHMSDERATGFPLVPTILAVMLQHNLDEYDLSALRYVTNTAAALPPGHVKELRQRLSHTRIYSMYGVTETKRTLCLPPDQIDERPESVGFPIPGTEVWLEDEAGNRLENAAMGELVIRGRHVMRGYWNAPEITAQRFRPAKLHGETVFYTGDLFRRDSDGFYYFVGRQDDIIKSRGKKVPPKLVENVLYDLPGVVEAAVIGVEDPILGQALKAFIVSVDKSLSEQQVLSHCRCSLESFMIPKFVEFRSDLPKTKMGKILKRDLR